MDDSPWMPPTSGTQPAEPVDAAPAAAAVGPSASAEPVLPPASPVPPAPPMSPASPWAPGGSADLAAPAPGHDDSAPVLPPATPVVVPVDVTPAALPDSIATAGPADTPAPARGRRSRVAVGAAVAAVLAVGAAGTFAVANMRSSSVGGAETPAELGEALLDAIEQEDVLAMADVLSPGEREVIRDPAIDLVGELTRLEVLAPEFDLSDVAGFDIALTNRAVSVRPTNVGDITNIDLRADVTATVNGAEVPVGALITDNMDPDEVADMRATNETDTDTLDVTLTAVEEDGRWYISLFHTAAEQIRADVSPDTPIPAVGLAVQGAETPEAAFDQALDRLESLDLTGLIASLNPGEAAALQRYAPLFITDAQRALDDVTGPDGIDLSWSITKRDVRIEGDGDRRTVFLDGLTIEGTAGDSTFTFAYDGDCVSVQFDGENEEQCTSTAAAEATADEMFADSPATTAFLDGLRDAFADMQPSGVELREYDGRWYVSPMSTFSEAVLNALRALDRQEIDHLIELGKAAGEELDDLFSGVFRGGDDSAWSDIEELDSGDGEWTTFPEVTVDTSVDYGTEYTGDGSADAATDWSRCYEVTDPTDATACFEEFVASGDIDESFLPVELRFPECGFADAKWGGRIYEMTDAEFIAAVEAARPCFLALVDEGRVQEWELPSEIVHLECFEGRNWYTVYDDPDYDERYWNCLDGAPTGMDIVVATTTAP